jgi:predicted DNA-binding protein
MAVAIKAPEQVAAGAERTTTVRVSVATHAALRQLADELGRPISQVVAEAVDHYRRNVFFDAFDAAVARLRGDPAAWAEELADRNALEGTLEDGLEPEEWTDADFTHPGAG